MLTTAHALPAPRYTYPGNDVIERLAEAIATKTFRDGQGRLVIHARKHLAAYFDALYPHATTWADYCKAFAPDARALLVEHLTGCEGHEDFTWDALPVGIQNKLVRAVQKEMDGLRGWGQLLLDWTARNQAVIDEASPEQLDEINALTEAAHAHVIPPGFRLFRADEHEAGARCAVLTRYGQRVEVAFYAPERRCFTFQTARIETGAVPLSDVVYVKPL